MYCTVCQKAEKRPFDRYTWNKIPATHLRLESIKSYENCVAHKDAVRQLALVQQCETIPGIVQPDVCLSSMAKHLLVCIFCAKTESPTQSILGLYWT